MWTVLGGVYEEIKSSLPALLTLWGMMKERRLGVKDALVVIEYASNRAKAEREVEVLTNKVSDLKNQANQQGIEIFAAKTQWCEILENKPPAIPKAAANRIVALGEKPNTKKPGADNHRSED